MAVELEKQGHLAINTLNRPEARNAINGEMAQTMGSCLDEFENDPELWVGILKAERIMANAPLAVQASRNVAARALMDDDEALRRASGKGFQSVVGTEDYQEGPRAFIEKRPPVWKGR